ncbi:isochorismate synthase [Carboxydochorda subterranea]|uniref:isochorismate synthase n=1 Tax=Carboxydichorda subterranea TaxID=3109565 RepID=A0ABZ1BXV7_9FIRM|nr:isochorismate synthase [Limnochorda sp. L945t]WRP17460.1 isochorismate synthase [Limnochorda sp. L945t]
MARAIHLAVEAARKQARALGHPVLASAVLPVGRLDPSAAFVGALSWPVHAPGPSRSAPGWQRFALAAGDEGPTIIGVGAEWTLTAAGDARFEEIQARFRRLVEVSTILRDGNGDLRDGHGDGHPAATGIVALGGFRYDPHRSPDAAWQQIADADFMIPRFLLTIPAGPEPALLTINLAVSASADAGLTASQAASQARALIEAISQGLAPQPPEVSQAPPPAPDDGARRWLRDDGADRWLHEVRLAVEAIREGRLSKVVLARALDVEAPGPLDPGRLFEALWGQCPGCARFALSYGGMWFIGASPERLAAVDAGGQVRSMALAGSTGRATRCHEDEALARALFDSPKERHEHRLVVDALREALAPLTESLQVPGTPRLLRLASVQHLHTPLAGRLRAGISVVDVVKALHPTPAVGGHPKAAALEWLRGHEEFDRGWYSAPIGWWDAQGNGDFWVAIRSARLEEARATLFAGCGIVADSRPESEWEESWLKLQPMLRVLEEGWRRGRIERTREPGRGHLPLRA